MRRSVRWFIFAVALPFVPVDWAHQTASLRNIINDKKLDAMPEAAPVASAQGETQRRSQPLQEFQIGKMATIPAPALDHFSCR